MIATTRHLITVACLVLTGAGPFGGEQPEGILKGSSATFSLRDPAVRIIAGVVRQRSETPVGVNGSRSEVTYDITVRCDDRSAIKEGTSAKIEGEIGSQSAGYQHIPVMQPGATFVMVCHTTADAGVLKYWGPAMIIGLSTPCEVNEADVVQIKPALARLGEIAKTPALALSREDAQKLMARKENYYLWALGAAGLASLGDRDASDVLYRVSLGKDVTVREIVWLEHCFASVLPEAVAPPLQVRHQLLVQFLERLAGGPQRDSTPASQPD